MTVVKGPLPMAGSFLTFNNKKGTKRAKDVAVIIEQKTANPTIKPSKLECQKSEATNPIQSQQEIPIKKEIKS